MHGGWYGLTTPEEQDIDQLLKPYAKHVVEKEGYTAMIPKVSEYLFQNKIEKAYVCGMDTDCCVLITAVDLFQLGIEPVVLIDYCASNGGQESHKAAIRLLERLIGRKRFIQGNCRNENRSK
ncbi:nicotinamidase-related amidase [Croceifilum oryzae]|uniref:Nicotinamidase-related amidase n=1 Tax=Croceifilum oryzae TaxID=1553429 RepID=A0AAJ1TPL2_9BACL|nr:isochorismatase family protein [Croceifilum oryzae]MDQ0418590.1 nicotinamidase-related amidase [Croceifilum oryzae]